MKQLRCVAILLILLTVVAAPASAAVTYLSANRYVSAGLNQAGTLCCGGIYGSTSQFGPYNVDGKFPGGFIYPEGTLSVIMNSNIDSLGITFMGTLIADLPPGFATESEVGFGVQFVVDRPTPFIGDYSRVSGMQSFAALLPINVQPFPHVIFPGQGVLPPGEYRVFGTFKDAINHDGGSFVSNYSLHFLFIPEPSTAVLLLAAVLPLSTPRRTRVIA